MAVRLVEKRFRAARLVERIAPEFVSLPGTDVFRTIDNFPNFWNF